MHEPRDLKRDSLTNWQPVQLPQRWCDVVSSDKLLDRKQEESGLIVARLVIWLEIVR